jgi:mRNA interferase MazF
MPMKQGELWYANLSPVVGSEQSGMRPLLIISGNLLNAYLNVVICCPLRTKVKNYKGNLVLNPDNINNLSETSEVLTFHVRSVSKSRLIKKIGSVSKEDLKLVKKCLDEILTY